MLLNCELTHADDSLCNTWDVIIQHAYRVAQKLSHYQMIKKLLLNRIKTCQ